MQLQLPFSPFKNNAARCAPWAFGAALSLCVGAMMPVAAQTVYGLTPAGLVNFEAGSPSSTVSAVKPIAGLTAGQVLVGLDVRPNTGELFALGYDATTTQAQLYTIDPASAAATPVAPAITLALGSATDRIGFDFNPTVDRIRVVSTNGANFRLNPNNGALGATDGSLKYATTDANNAQTPGVGAVAYTNSYIGTGTTMLYGVDEINNRLVLQNPPNDGILNTVGTAPLGVTTSGPAESTDIDIYFNPTNRQNQAYLLTNSPTANQLLTVNLTTGVAADPVTIGNGSLGITDIAVAIDRTVPAAVAGRLLYATQTAGTTTNLLSFGSSAPTLIRSLVPITGLEADQKLVSIDSRPSTGELFGLGYNAAATTANARLYTINPATGVATPVGAAAMTLELGTATDFIDFDFNPQVDRIRVVSTNRANYRLNPITGTIVMRDKDIVFNNTTNPPSIAAAAYTNSFLGTSNTELVVYDNTLNQLFLQSPPNDGILDAAGPAAAGISISPGTSVGLDIHTTTTRGNYTLLTATPTTSTYTELYDMNLSSGGVAKALGRIGFGVTVNNLAFAIDRIVPVDVKGQLLYALEGSNLISFDSSAPQIIRTSTAITGLAADHTLVGLDFRPANGDLYALGYNATPATGNNAQLYRINFTTGALTAVGSGLRLELGDATARIGFDFNPVVDLIRVVSSNNANLRLSPSTGELANTDTDFTFSGVAISSAAYTNSAPGPLATSTTLYHYDGATNQLYRQDPPNTGALVAVGTTPNTSLPINPALGVDFDIFFDAEATGDAQNKAFLVASPVITDPLLLASNDNLYTVDLNTGATTLVNRIGGGTAVSGVSALIKATVLSNSKASAKLSAQVDVFPNPATGEVSISMPATLGKQNVEATLVNTLGQPVLRRTLSARDGSTQRLALNGVAKGVYMLQLSTSEGVVTKRLLVR